MITQSEADELIAMRKKFVDSPTISISPGVDETYELVGEEPREHFLLDIWRGTLRISKIKYQTRGRKVIILVRLDVDGSPHTNPDGVRLAGTHIHLYRDGYEDKWAHPIDPSQFRNLTDVFQIFEDFCSYCNIGGSYTLQRGFV